MKDGLDIGEVARQTQLQPSAIRYYESVGLLPAPRRENGRRRYDAKVFDQLNIIRVAQLAGLTISEIHTLLTDFPEHTPASERWEVLASKKLVEVNELIRNAMAMKALLERMLGCECVALDACAATVTEGLDMGCGSGKPS
jgi:MerR family redox-sensitive transcriptional activator SoxR